MSMKLNRNLPFGEIMGVFADVPGAKYSQGGVYFDSAGNAILSDEQKAARKAQLAAELAALNEDDPVPAPVAASGPVAETMPLPAAEIPASAEVQDLTPAQKAAATRAANKKAAASALPPLPE